MSACNCCAMPPCPSVVFECESFSASASKLPPCGHFNTADGKHYTTLTITRNWTRSETGGAPDTCSYTLTGSATSVDTIVFSRVGGVCSSNTTYAGSGGSSLVNSGDDCDPPLVYSCEQSRTPTGFWNVRLFQDGTLVEERLESSFPCLVNASADDYVYSEEVTPESTEELIARVAGLIPGTPNGTWCSAVRNLSPTENSYSIRRVRWRLRHSPSATCYLKVWLRRRFSPEGGGPAVFTDLPPYEWAGSGNPCYADPSKPPTDSANVIFSPWQTQNEPATDGTVSIEVVKLSCVPGYEPLAGQPNGYPDPE